MNELEIIQFYWDNRVLVDALRACGVFQHGPGSVTLHFDDMGRLRKIEDNTIRFKA